MEENYFNIQNKDRAIDILKQELDVNAQEQVLIKQRISTIEDYLKSVENSDPQYALMLSQIEMDKIFLDELIQKQEDLVSKLKTINIQ